MILSTYEQPEWLRLVLWGYAAQTFRDFEIVIADDGSGESTLRAVDEVREAAGLEIRHVWQEDRGFRKCRALNRAILASAHDYLVFSDGDCVPRADFLETHVELARPGRFLSGGALRLSREVSESITVDDVVSGRATRLGWLVARGWRPGHRWLRMAPRPVAALLDAVTPARASWNGGNASTWRAHVEAVNGFDERIEYGYEDRTFGARLENLGVPGVQVRHRTVLVHLEHGRPWKDPEGVARNREILHRIEAEGTVRTPHGLAETTTDEAGEGPA